MNNNNGGRDVTYEIIEHIGVIATYATGWRKEINFVSWNGAAAKYDIRDWSPSRDSMSRGITIRENEMRLLLDLMRRRGRSAPSRSTYADNWSAPPQDAVQVDNPPEHETCGDSEANQTQADEIQVDAVNQSEAIDRIEQMSRADCDAAIEQMVGMAVAAEMSEDVSVAEEVEPF